MIVDTPDSTIKTNRDKGQREYIFEVRPFEMNELKSINDYNLVLERLKFLKCDDLVETFIGGKPLFYNSLSKKILKENDNEENRKKDIKYIRDLVNAEFTNSFQRVNIMLNTNKELSSELKALIQQFDNNKKDIYIQHNRTISLLNNSCFRLLKEEQGTKVVPVSNSVDIILRNYSKLVTADSKSLDDVLKVLNKKVDESRKTIENIAKKE